MHTITVFGSSDDLIEVEGDLTEEFNVTGQEETMLSFSDGHLLSMRYDSSGVWRITIVQEGDSSCVKSDAGFEDESHGSDRVELTGENLHWVVLANPSTFHRIGAGVTA